MGKKSGVISRRKPRQTRAQETAQCILQATAQILVSRGFKDCSTNHIAERAGVSIGTLYQYFADKQSILLELFRLEIEKDALFIQNTLQELENQPIEIVIKKLVSVTLKRLSENPRLRQILLLEVSSSRQTEKLRGIKDELSELLSSYLKSHPQFHIRHDIRLEVLIIVNSVEAALYAAIQEYGPRLKHRILVAEVSDLVLRYLSKYRLSTGVLNDFSDIS